MTAEHHVTVHQAPSPEPEAEGMQAIIMAFIKNPGAAIQLVLYIIGACGLYYAMQLRIDEVQAKSEAHYRDLAAEMSKNYDKISGKIDVLVSNDASEVAKIEGLYSRGDTRYSNIVTKLSEHDVDIARIATGVEYLVKQSGGVPSPLLPHEHH